MERICRIFKRYPLSLLLLVMIIYLSFFKPPTTSFSSIDNIDKIAHFVMYFGFCSILWFEYFFTHLKIRANKTFWGAILAPIIFSGFVELGQLYFTEYRGGDWLDFVFNVFGVVVAALFSVYVTKPLMIKYDLWNKRNK